jgi:hypothetical protein
MAITGRCRKDTGGRLHFQPREKRGASPGAARRETCCDAYRMQVSAVPMARAGTHANRCPQRVGARLADYKGRGAPC